jgi:hypothetical protein
VCVCAPPHCCPHAFYPRERLHSLRRPPRVLPLGAPHQAPPRAARVPPRAFYYTPRAVLMRTARSIGCACVCRLYAVMSHLYTGARGLGPEGILITDIDIFCVFMVLCCCCRTPDIVTLQCRLDVSLMPAVCAPMAKRLICAISSFLLCYIYLYKICLLEYTISYWVLLRLFFLLFSWENDILSTISFVFYAHNSFQRGAANHLYAFK